MNWRDRGDPTIAMEIEAGQIHLRERIQLGTFTTSASEPRATGRIKATTCERAAIVDR